MSGLLPGGNPGVYTATKIAVDRVVLRCGIYSS